MAKNAIANDTLFSGNVLQRAADKISCVDNDKLK